MFPDIKVQYYIKGSNSLNKHIFWLIFKDIGVKKYSIKREDVTSWIIDNREWMVESIGICCIFTITFTVDYIIFRQYEFSLTRLIIPLIDELTNIFLYTIVHKKEQNMTSIGNKRL